MTAPLADLVARADASGDWSASNQAWLMGAVAAVARRLQQHAGIADDTWAAPEPAWPNLSLPPPALETLCGTFRLSAFERDVLVACAGVELDARFGALCAAAHGSPPDEAARRYPTFSLALAAFAGPHWSALGPDAPLRRWRLIEAVPGTPLTAAALRIDEWVLHFLAGVRQRDERLSGRLMAVEPPDILVASQREQARMIAALWAEGRQGVPLPVIQLVGAGPEDRQLLAAAACQHLGLNLLLLRADAVPVTHAEIDAMARLCEREIGLTGAVLMVECDSQDAGEPAVRAARRLAASVFGLVLLGDRDPHPIEARDMVTWIIPPPSPADRHAAWQEALAEHDLSGDLDRLMWSFGLGLPAITAAAAEIRARAASTAGPVRVGDIAWSVCRTHARARLGGLATRVEPSAGWDDLVLPPLQAALLRQVLVQVRNRATVYGKWGFGVRMATTLGISALFHGPSGTGKSMAAEVIAAELELDLFRIDLSAVVSKYIGETEENLRRVFEAAEASGAVLVFDEADALFGKRSEVKDSHDRYANIQVSYLLQRMETYRGLAVLTTNLRSSMDTAFLRRLRFIVGFPFPDAAQRAEIWRRAFPADLPTRGVDLSRLARLDLTGGNIRNIVLGAAFLAADAGEPVQMAHLAEAARAEYAKLERPFNESEVAGWA